MQRATIGRVIEGANGGTKSNDVGGRRNGVGVVRYHL